MPYLHSVRLSLAFQCFLLCGKELLGDLWMLDLHFLLGFIDDLGMLFLLLLVDPFGVEKAIPKSEIQGIVILLANSQFSSA